MKKNYREFPRGVGSITSGKPGDKMVDLDVLIFAGSRAQRRFAQKELKKLENARRKNGGQ